MALNWFFDEFPLIFFVRSFWLFWLCNVRYAIWILNQRFAQLLSHKCVCTHTAQPILFSPCNSIKFFPLFRFSIVILLIWFVNVLFFLLLAYRILFVYNQWYEIFWVEQRKNVLNLTSLRWFALVANIQPSFFILFFFWFGFGTQNTYLKQNVCWREQNSCMWEIRQQSGLNTMHSTNFNINVCKKWIYQQKAINAMSRTKTVLPLLTTQISSIYITLK